jgi:hypothetical protein
MIPTAPLNLTTPRSHALVNRRLLTVLTGILFFAAMIFSYTSQVSVLFEYMGFERDFRLSRLLLSSLAIILCGLAVGQRESVTSFFQYIIYLAYLCPALVLYSAGGASNKYILVVFTGLTILFLFSSIKVKPATAVQSSMRVVLLTVFLISALTVTAIILLGGGSYFNLDLFAVYQFRGVAADNLPSFFGYITSPLAKVVLPLGILIALRLRRWTIVSVFLVLSVALFGLTHHKSVLAIPIATVMFYLALKRFGIQRGISVLFAAASVYLSLTGTTTPGLFSTFVVRRVFLVPPLLDSFYLEFFANNPFFYWANSRVTFGIVETSYAMNMPFLIGEHYFNSPTTSANTGFIGSGYANLGLAGIVLYAAIIGTIISVLNGHGKRVGVHMVVCASIPVMLTAITTTDLVTVFLTHGLLLLFIFLAFMPRSAL